MNKKIIIVSVALSILLLTFYWFQSRPAQIKISCQQEADEYFDRAFAREDTDKDGLIYTDDIDWITKRAKDKYNFCLHRNGL